MSSKERRSQFWLHFTDMNSDNVVQCLLCSQKLSVKNNSTCSLIRHMNKKHPTVPIEKKGTRHSEITVKQYVEDFSEPSQVWMEEEVESHEDNNENPLQHDPPEIKLKENWNEVEYEVIEEDEIDRNKMAKRKIGEYSKEDLQRAIELVNNGVSIRMAAKQCKLPYPTLRRYVRKHIWMEEVVGSHEENNKNPLQHDHPEINLKKKWNEIEYEVVEEDEYSIFSKLIISKLRKLSNRNRLIAQNRITNILFDLELEESEQAEKESSVMNNTTTTQEPSSE